MKRSLGLLFTLFGLFYLCACQSGVTGLPQSRASSSVSAPGPTNKNNVTTAPPLAFSSPLASPEPISALLPIPTAFPTAYQIPSSDPARAFFSPPRALGVPSPLPTTLPDTLPGKPDIHEISGKITNQNTPLITYVSLNVPNLLNNGQNTFTAITSKEGKYTITLPLYHQKKINFQIRHTGSSIPLYETEIDLQQNKYNLDVSLNYPPLATCCQEADDDPRAYIYGSIKTTTGTPLTNVQIKIVSATEKNANNEPRLYDLTYSVEGVYRGANNLPGKEVQVEARYFEQVLTQKVSVDTYSRELGKNRVDFVFPSP